MCSILAWTVGPKEATLFPEKYPDVAEFLQHISGWEPHDFSQRLGGSDCASLVVIIYNIWPHEAVAEVSKGKIYINQKNMCL